MVRFRRSLHPVISTKNVHETSGILGAGTNTTALTLVTTVDSASLAVPNSVERGGNVGSFFLSAFFIGEGGELASEVPLVDWYVMKNPGGNFSGFDATNFPTPGAQGVHDNKRYIFHTEKGLTGGGDASLSGVPMIFKNPIRIPRHMQKMNANDTIILNARSNFATKFCVQVIYKWMH